MLRLKTLGELSLWRGTEPVAAGEGPPYALHCLAILALAGDRAVSSDDVIALLWPDASRDEALRTLDALVAALPASLGGARPVQRLADGLRLDRGEISSDVRDLEFAAASGAPDEAARLYGGSFLHGVTPPSRSFERWREREAARLEQVAKWSRDAVRPRRSAAQLVPGAQIGHGGRYRIERELGAGGAATVYVAHDARHERPVAIKVLREDVSEAISPERFEQEIRILAQLQHPHILPLFDSGELGPVLYSVMPYVAGETVRQRLDREGAFPVADAVRICAEVAGALAYAHERGVLHRDVKPENILLSDGHALLADFGIARSVDPKLPIRTTLPGVVLGTLPYMSPEQASGEAELDGRTDVYAVGAVLYEMLSGRPPFAGETARQMMTLRLTETPPRVSLKGVRVPSAVDAALERALQPLPEERATAAELADALGKALRRLSEGTVVQPEPRRSKLVTGIVIVVLAVLALLFTPKCAGAQLSAGRPLDAALLRRLLAAEDARGTGADGIAPLLEGARSGDTALARVAVRALGRLQRPELIGEIMPMLAGPSPALRSEAANAMAQSVHAVPRGLSTPEARRDTVARVQRALADRLAREPDAHVLGVLARSLGRLPHADSASARAAERAIVDAVARQGALEQLPGGAVADVAEGLYALARARRIVGDVSGPARALLRGAAARRTEARVRRVALLALGAAGALDSTLVLAAAGDPDAQVRRLALAGVGALASETRVALLRRALTDPSPMVRVDAVRASRAGTPAPDCAPIVAATRDPNPHVMLAAIDALGAPCADGAARTAALRAIAGSLSAGDVARANGRASWHGPAHAIVALARADASAAAPILPRFVAHPRAQVREYAARAAITLRDAAVLSRLATDADHNVCDAAIGGLAQLRGHDADSVYLRALESQGHQVVMAAATALAGSAHPAVPPALLVALDRLTAARRENSRDPRVTILNRLSELGRPTEAPRVEPYLTDFDSTVAAKAAELLTKWKGTRAVARPVALPIRAEPLAETYTSDGLQLRITMAASSGGGTFAVRLFPDEAPATVARVVRLAREHYYDGLTFHRVVPNFVIQGGSPDANEYAGDGPFMRDELGLRSHDRGTLGISTRGRDTGDAQIFVNLVDNPRLDHDYTVFGEVISGMAVVDGIFEGDVIARVEVTTAPPPARPRSG